MIYALAVPTMMKRRMTFPNNHNGSYFGDEKMKRSLQTSGGKGHVRLVKLASKRIIEQFEGLRYMLVSYEKTDLQTELRISDGAYGYTNVHFDFRPDIVVRVVKEKDEQEKRGIFREDREWNSVLDSNTIVFEIETNPRNIFRNQVKIGAYKKIRSDRYGRTAYAFVLVCWEDANLPKNIEPFDEVWKFKRP